MNTKSFILCSYALLCAVSCGAMSTLQTMLGSYYATNFIRFRQMYKVMVQASPEYRETPESILNLYLKNERWCLSPHL